MYHHFLLSARARLVYGLVLVAGASLAVGLLFYRDSMFANVLGEVFGVALGVIVVWLLSAYESSQRRNRWSAVRQVVYGKVAVAVMRLFQEIDLHVLQELPRLGYLRGPNGPMTFPLKA